MFAVATTAVATTTVATACVGGATIASFAATATADALTADAARAAALAAAPAITTVLVVSDDAITDACPTGPHQCGRALRSAIYVGELDAHPCSLLAGAATHPALGGQFESVYQARGRLRFLF